VQMGGPVTYLPVEAHILSVSDPLRSAQRAGFIMVAWMKSTSHQHSSRHMGSYVGSFSLPPPQSHQGPVKMHQAKCPLRPRRNLRRLFISLGSFFHKMFRIRIHDDSPKVVYDIGPLGRLSNIRPIFTIPTKKPQSKPVHDV
jgi:hypothetical protein